MQQKFSENDIHNVWKKGEVESGYNPDEYRKDQCGAWIKRDKYGDIDSILGWEIDHIKPSSDDGSDSIYNLRPLQWENNRATSDGRLTCPIKSNGNRNISE